ncbi:uncharacterized protein NEMAJ01_1389 [Nematocida major]|uniref:uncharacterized protein n=1 Tax=Nematocida major TaxID=1912982 RepID=UPI002007F887|nr:uncharacterized protein NEMAJ01_1389 [Nematocida major]KAH9386493.1 hypothetical protein NEMAJ01_1389 [Nematocida major]
MWQELFLGLCTLQFLESTIYLSHTKRKHTRSYNAPIHFLFKEARKTKRTKFGKDAASRQESARGEGKHTCMSRAVPKNAQAVYLEKHGDIRSPCINKTFNFSAA